jgi:hypothetical protein
MNIFLVHGNLVTTNLFSVIDHPLIYTFLSGNSMYKYITQISLGHRFFFF